AVSVRTSLLATTTTVPPEYLAYQPSRVWDSERIARNSEEIKEMISKMRSDIAEVASSLILDRFSSKSYHNASNETAVLFGKLAEQWRSETQFSSSILDICTHPAYQRIIGMGRAAIALILQELRSAPDHWFWALKAITGEDPVPKQDRGKLPKMAEAWLSWGAQNGYTA
ncbi:MAG: hypothetical protein NTX50_19855, partial [Candidatus Sumerlaeota bacterium]|nr:hypothetical protein [Candidatus Sumerlaeota bacterium]